ncbi:MAG: AmmeMemoRadiSam system radical SAM enzyme [Candidatus Cloacimonas sp.]
MREAMFYLKEGDKIKCQLCPRECLLSEGQKGFCRSREVINGALIATSYGKTIALSLDPIEKKPLYHFHPGSMIVSLGPNACNLTCKFCQNWEISQQDCFTRFLSIEELIAVINDQPIKQVAFTYTEPLMWYEYILDFAAQAPEIDVVLVTNAYLNKKPWQNILKVTKAVNIDIKSYRDKFYRDICGGKLEVILANIITAKEMDVHIELTNLLIPGYNDSEEELTDLAKFIASVDLNIPLHISAYRPCYKMNVRPTTSEEVENACEIASRYLKYVYAGNVHSSRFYRR